MDLAVCYAGRGPLKVSFEWGPVSVGMCVRVCVRVDGLPSSLSLESLPFLFLAEFVHALPHVCIYLRLCLLPQHKPAPPAVAGPVGLRFFLCLLACTCACAFWPMPFACARAMHIPVCLYLCACMHPSLLRSFSLAQQRGLSTCACARACACACACVSMPAYVCDLFVIALPP